MKEFTLKAESVSKYFIRGINIFRDIDLTLSNGDITALAGENGSGKTTFLKILSGILPPSKGKISLNISGKELKTEEFTDYIGFVSPYLTLYEEFTPIEHFKLFAKLRRLQYDEGKVAELLKLFKIFNRRDDVIKTFSSGMKQRIKYVLAMQSEPDILFLDEPFTNLDAQGIDAVINIVKTRAALGCGVIIASNDDREKQLCINTVFLKK